MCTNAKHRSNGCINKRSRLNPRLHKVVMRKRTRVAAKFFYSKKIGYDRTGIFNVKRDYDNLMHCHVNKQLVPMGSDEAKIKLTYLNGTGYVFNADDYMKLRVEHRVIGSMMGTSCLRGWSANSCNLPVELSQYETRLLLEKGIALLLSKSIDLLRQPKPEELRSYVEENEAKLYEQEEHLKDGKVKESLHYIDKIMYGKRKKMLASGVPESDIKLTKEEVLQEIRDNTPFDRKNALVEIHCEHPRIHEGIPVHVLADDSLKYRVFRDFWERGKYITCGEAFGADFIVYPGDPIVFHASHIIIVLQEPAVQPLELIAKARLSVIVNKLCVFVYVGKDNKLSYQTVLWEGNKEGQKQ